MPSQQNNRSTCSGERIVAGWPTIRAAKDGGAIRLTRVEIRHDLPNPRTRRHSPRSPLPVTRAPPTIPCAIQPGPAPRAAAPACASCTRSLKSRPPPLHSFVASWLFPPPHESGSRVSFSPLHIMRLLRLFHFSAPSGPFLGRPLPPPVRLRHRRQLRLVPAPERSQHAVHPQRPQPLRLDQRPERPGHR